MAINKTVRQECKNLDPLKSVMGLLKQFFLAKSSLMDKHLVLIEEQLGICALASKLI